MIDKLINKNQPIQGNLVILYLCESFTVRKVKTCRTDMKSIPALENRTLARDEGHSQERLSSARDFVLLCKHSWMVIWKFY